MSEVEDFIDKVVLLYYYVSYIVKVVFVDLNDKWYVVCLVTVVVVVSKYYLINVIVHVVVNFDSVIFYLYNVDVTEVRVSDTYRVYKVNFCYNVIRSCNSKVVVF